MIVTGYFAPSRPTCQGRPVYTARCSNGRVHESSDAHEIARIVTGDASVEEVCRNGVQVNIETFLLIHGGGDAA